ncbi:MAG: hypothetical protein U0Q21_00015 [Dermatophilaceae bacterium]
MLARTALLTGLLFAGPAVAGCTTSPVAPDSRGASRTAETTTPRSSGPATTSTASTATASASGPATGTDTGTCGPPTAAPQGPAARMAVLSDGGAGSPKVSAALYPKPAGPAKLWSQWGQGVVLPDGRFVSAAGTHDGADGNSYVFMFDPASGVLTRVSDVLSLVPHTPGDWGYGKIHAQMVRSGCDVVFGTFWGDRDGLTYTANYPGDRLFALDTASYAITDLGVPVPRHGIPSLAGGGGLIYGEAADPLGRAGGAKEDVGVFFAYNPATKTVVYESNDQRHMGFRTIAVGADGSAYVAGLSAGLLRYRPGGALEELPARLPGGGWLRASTAPADDGTVYAATRTPERFLAIDRAGAVSDLGPAPGYVASMALSPDGREVLFVPDAHGVAWEKGTPLMALDIATGKVRTVVALEPLVRERLGLVAGGSYDIAVDARAKRAFIGLNAGATTDNPWGEVVLVEVDL